MGRFAVIFWLLAAAITPAQTGALTDAERRAAIVVDCKIGFGGAVPVRGLWPLILEFHNRGENAVEIEVEIDGATVGSDEKLFTRRRLVVSPETSKRFELIEGGGDRFSRQIVLRTAESLNWYVKGPQFSPIDFADKNEISFDLGRVRGFVVSAIVPVIGGRARQIGDGIPVKASMAGWLSPELTIGGVSGAFAPVDPADLPLSRLAYSDCEAIIWTEPDPKVLEPAAFEAILDWVSSGGTLILVSAHLPEALENDGLSRLLPGRLEGFTPTLYGRFTQSRDRNDPEGPTLRFATAPDARPIFTTNAIHWPERVPVRYERRFGMGRVITAAVDPFAFDRGAVQVFADAFGSILGLSIAYRDSRFGFTSFAAPAFLGDTIGEILRNGKANRPPLGPFFILAVAYVWLIGKFDFDFLRKKKRLRWSPFTLLAYAGVFSLICIGISASLFSGTAEMNRIAVVDFYVDHEGRDRANAQVYDGVFAPFGGRFAFAPKGDYDYYSAPATRDTGLALRLRSAELQDFDGAGKQAYRPELPVNSFRTIETRANGAPTGTIDVSVEGSDEEIFVWRVTVRNRLARPITHGLFLWGGGFVPIPDIAAGATYSTLAGMPMRDPKVMPSGEIDLFSGKTAAAPRWEQVIDLRRTAGVPDGSLVAALRSLSMKSWCARMKGLVEAPQMPWDLASRLDTQTALFWGLTDEMVIPDERPLTNRGFTHVIVRRLVHLPRVDR